MRLWGTIGLPLLAMLYVRQKDLQKIVPWYKVKFQTKLEQASGAGRVGGADATEPGQNAVGRGRWGLCQAAVFASVP